MVMGCVVVEMDAEQSRLRTAYQELESTHSGSMAKLRAASKAAKETKNGLAAMAEENQALRMQMAKAQGRCVCCGAIAACVVCELA